MRSRFSSATNTSSVAWQVARFGDCRRQLTDKAELSAVVHGYRRCSDRAPETALASSRNVAATPSARTSRSTTPLSRRNRPRAPPDQCAAWRRAGPRERHARVSPPDENACRSRTARRRVGRGGGCERRRRPGRAGATAAACRTCRRADSRRQQLGRRPPLSNASAAFASMNPNVTASDRPAAVSTRRTSRSRGIAGSGGGAGAVTTGNVAGELVEAVMPADFLDEIDLAQEIDAERRRDDVPAVCRRPSRSGRDSAECARLGSGTAAPSSSASRFRRRCSSAGRARTG